MYRQFSKSENVEEFLNGTMPFGNGASNYGVGTYTFDKLPEKDIYGENVLEMALKSSDNKILKIENNFDSQLDIAKAATPDTRIPDILLKAPPDKRKQILSVAAAEYGYDAIEVQSQLHGKYVLVLNRTAVIVKGD